ncbi:MAG TPA: S66 peptidase family protein [Candidatus Paceibacterota bacterium]
MFRLSHKLKKLKDGATIGIISPSSDAASIFPEVYQLGVGNLKKYFNFNVKEFAATKARYSPSQEHVLARVKDIHAAFLDKEVDAIITAIGGDDSIRLLPHLDKNIVEENPKIFMGFSDAVSLLTYFAKLGLPSFHGPALMAGFAEPEGLMPEVLKHFKSFFMDAWKTYPYDVFTQWTEDKYGWTDSNFPSRRKSYVRNTPPHILNRGTNDIGILVGGCIEIIEMLKGTAFGLQSEDWGNAAFFFETSEDKPTPDYVKCALRSYGMAGAWHKASLILIGKSRGYSMDEYRELEDGVLEVVVREFGAKNIRIVSNYDFGHTQPINILPIGCTIQTDDEGNLTLIESPFE